MALGGLTALGTRERGGPLSGRAWSAQSHSETGRGEPTTLIRTKAGFHGQSEKKMT